MNSMKTFNIENEPKIKTGFIVPGDYFENISSKVLLRLPENEPKIISLSLRRKKWFYAAAAVLILGLSIPVYNYLKNPFSGIDQTALEDYIVYNSTISETELTHMLNENEIQNININIPIDNKTIENELSNKSDLEQFLLN